MQKEKKRLDSPKTPPRSPPYQPHPPPLPVGPSGTSGSPGSSESSQVLPPPPPPLSANQEDQSHGSAAPSSSKTAASAEYKAWTTTDTRLRPFWKPLKEDRTATSEPVWSIPSSDVHVPKNNWASALASTYSPLPEDSLLAQTGDMAMFMDWFYKRQGITELKPQDLEGPAFELVKVFHPNMIHLQPALSISKMKAAYYLDVGLEQMVPDQMWIDEECKYDIGHLNHLPPKDKKIFTTAINLWTRHLVIRQRVKDFQLDYKALDYRVKEFKVNRMNLGLNKRFWTRKDVDRSKEFMFTIQKRLKIRRIFRNLESFVGGRVRD
nr:hypothetical protein [Tanacetum cinerariifolium]GEX62878.1 hypothetical protein [Tanacetum cinerariifolium]